MATTQQATEHAEKLWSYAQAIRGSPKLGDGTDNCMQMRQGIRFAIRTICGHETAVADREHIRRYLFPDTPSDKPDLAFLPLEPVKAAEKNKCEIVFKADNTLLREAIGDARHHAKMLAAYPDHRLRRHEHESVMHGKVVGLSLGDWVHVSSSKEGGCTIPVNLIFNDEVTKETIMTRPTTLKIETQVLLNGEPASKYSASELYDMIAAQEATIKELEAIQTKPKALEKEIADRKAGIAALVAYMDSLPA